MRELCVLFASDDCHALTAKHKAIVLPLQQHQDVFQQNDMQLNQLGATQAPRQRTFIQHLILRQVQLLHIHISQYGSGTGCNMLAMNIHSTSFTHYDILYTDITTAESFKSFAHSCFFSFAEEITLFAFLTAITGFINIVIAEWCP